MAFSGLIHGPPLIAQPGQFCIVNVRPSRLHSSATNPTRPSHGALRHVICGSTPGHLPPNCPWKRWMPLMPAPLIASRSAVMPGFATLPPMKWNHVSGLFATDGSRNSASGSPAAFTAAANAIAATVMSLFIYISSWTCDYLVGLAAYYTINSLCG